MNASLIKRRSFLSERKNCGQRVTIGFTGIADFRSFIGQEYIAGIMKAVADYDINLINMAGAIKYSLFDDMDFIRHYLKKFRFMKSPFVDGMVIWASSLCQYMDNESVIRTFNALQPLPMVDIGYLDIEGVPSIRIDNRSAFHLLMEHMVKTHKFRRFAFIGTAVSNPHKTRLACYRSELALYGIKEIENSTYISPSMESRDIAAGVAALAAHFDLHGRKNIDAIITTSDIIAAAVIDELSKLGISVPADVAVTGYNNQYAGITALSPITTINLEYFHRGYTAVELLIDRIMEPSKKVPVRLVSTSLVIRQSCGCFEKSILEAGSGIPCASDAGLSDSASESDIREYLYGKINSIFMQQTPEEKQHLVDAIFSDVYETNSDSVLLTWFRQMIQKYSQNDMHSADVCSSSCMQQYVTELRRLILPLVRGEEKKIQHIENILHQLRVMISVTNDYSVLAQRENIYFMNKITDTAVDFASAASGKELCDVLRYQLNEMQIPGIMLVLGEHATADLGAAALDFVHPEPEPYLAEKLPLRIASDGFIPRSFFPKDRSYCMMLEILHHGDSYFGYAMMEMRSDNVALYDAVSLMISHSLYVLYLREGRSGGRNPLLETKKAYSILNSGSDTAADVPADVSGARRITDYLANHLNEMTDLDKMAGELGISKSHLVRQAKKLTGYTIQSLHEKMKIEQAQKLLLIGNMKLSEIAGRLGFQNQNYFSAVFKKCTGLSPHNWVLHGKH